MHLVFPDALIINLGQFPDYRTIFDLHNCNKWNQIVTNW
ncbi:MAG: hypothetical protein QG663_1308 [Thermodesulfobacteriota bacterium]|nr:hypothetical protein [Thermodesulfobacteriota bacterium]